MHGYEGLIKIMHGCGREGLNDVCFFRIKNDSRTRGHGRVLVKYHCIYFNKK